MPHQINSSFDPSVDQSMLQSQADDRGQLGRRTFLISLGVGTAAIAGYFVVRCRPSALATASSDPPISTLLPRLEEKVTLGRDGDLMTLRHLSEEDSPLCAVNRYGAEIVALLDGRHTVPQIANILAGRMGIPLTETMQSKIAYFITQVGEMGFLQEPYYACIVETTESC